MKKSKFVFSTLLIFIIISMMTSAYSFPPQQSPAPPQVPTPEPMRIVPMESATSILLIHDYEWKKGKFFIGNLVTEIKDTVGATVLVVNTSPTVNGWTQDLVAFLQQRGLIGGIAVYNTSFIQEDVKVLTRWINNGWEVVTFQGPAATTAAEVRGIMDCLKSIPKSRPDIFLTQGGVYDPSLVGDLRERVSIVIAMDYPYDCCIVSVPPTTVPEGQYMPKFLRASGIIKQNVEATIRRLPYNP